MSHWESSRARVVRSLGRVAAAVVLAVGLGLAAAGPASANSGTIVENGAAVNATVTTAGGTATFSFSGQSGDVVTVSAFSGTFTGGCDATLILRDPVGTTLGQSTCSGTTGFIGETTLPATGTYQILVAAEPGKTGAITLSLSKDAAPGTIVVNGAPVTFTASHTGQGRDYTFSGTAGDVVTASTYSGTFPNACDVYIRLIDARRNTLGFGGCAGTTGFIDETYLPGTGTYTLHVEPTSSNSGANVGSLTLTMSKNPAPGTIAVNGAPVTFTATHTAQGRDYTFSGTAGDVVTASTYSGTFPNACDVYIRLIDARRNTLGFGGCAGTTGFIDETYLPGTGTYTLHVEPTSSNSGANVGSLTLTMSKDPAPSTITRGGAAVTFTASHTAQGRDYTFSLTATTSVSVTASAGTFPNVCDIGMEIIDKGGRVRALNGCVGTSGTIAGTSLPGPGPYRLHVYPTSSNSGSNVGSVTLTLQ